MLPSHETSRFDANEREFLGITLARQIFGALYSAVEDRHTNHGLTRGELAERTGRDKTGVSKLLRGPSNWTIRTISDVANGLELDVEITFVDRYDRLRAFTPTGLAVFPEQPENYYVSRVDDPLLGTLTAALNMPTLAGQAIGVANFSEVSQGFTVSSTTSTAVTNVSAGNQSATTLVSAYLLRYPVRVSNVHTTRNPNLVLHQTAGDAGS